MVTSNNATPFGREVLKLRDGVIHYFTWVIITWNKHHEESVSTPDSLARKYEKKGMQFRDFVLYA